LDKRPLSAQRELRPEMVFNVRQTRKTLAFSKEVFFHETAALLEDCC
jgi:hypothetical protein